MAYLVRNLVKYSFNTPKTYQNTPKIRFLHVVRIRSLFFKCANVKFDIILIQIKIQKKHWKPKQEKNPQ